MKALFLIFFISSMTIDPSDAQDAATAAGEDTPEFETKVLDLLSAGKQSEAEKFMEGFLKDNQNNQRGLFLDAALIRSRFEIAEALPKFNRVVALDSQSPSGACAELMVHLDKHQASDHELAAMRELVKKFPNDLFLLWMLAVECRSYQRNEEGAACYHKLLQKWNPGPVLAHQTYANLLDNLHRYQDALVERQKAVGLEPQGWSYNGLAITLTHLKKFEEADHRRLT